MLVSYNSGRQLLATNLFRRNVCAVKFLMSTDSSRASSSAVPSTSTTSSSESSQSFGEPEGSRLLKVAIIGVPNAGKSTLINRLMSLDVCPVSSKPHTTRTTQNAILLEEEIQLVLADTPGVVNKKETKKFSIPEEFVFAPENSVRNADLIAVLHSIENKILRNKLDPKVIAVLQKFPMKPSILLVNKIDKIKGKRKLLNTVYHLCDGFVGGRPIPVTKQKPREKELNMDVLFRKTKVKMSMGNSVHEDNKSPGNDAEGLSNNAVKVDENGRVVRGWPNFQEVFLISALEGNGVANLKSYLKSNAISSPWAFNSEILTDCPPADLAIRIVKSKMLEFLKDEIPYILDPKLEFWDTNKRGVLRIVVGIKVDRERVLGMLFAGKKLEIIKEEAEKQLSVLLRVPVDLFINVVLTPKKK